MKSRRTIALLTILGISLFLMLGGCKIRKHTSVKHNSEQLTDRSEAIAPSDTAIDPKGDGKTATISIVDQGNVDDYPEKEEIRRAYKLTPGARIEISNINGSVEVETAPKDTAEVLIVRSAKKRDDLQFHKIGINHKPDYLNIRVENDRKSVFSALGSIPDGRQRVILKLPREVEFETRGINGPIVVGEIDGHVDIGGSNGPVKIGRAVGRADFHGVNGRIEAVVAKLDAIDLNGINGNAELRFIGDVNADIDAHAFNGEVQSDLQKVEIEKGAERYGRYKARIGSGGARIEIRGMNGNVYLGRADKPSVTATKVEAK